MSTLGEPFALTKSIRLRNRFVATAHAPGAVADGLPGPGDAEYWQRLAAGGIAMAITGGSVVSADSTIRRGNFTAAWRPEVRPALRRRAGAIHKAGAVAIFQLVHLGRETLGANAYYPPIAPSAVRSPREPTAPRAISESELDAVVESFRSSAANALEAGFDGIELHAAHGYLLAQFLSPVANRRSSAADLEGRVAPIWRIVESVRELDEAAVIGIRFSVGDAHDAGLTDEQLAELLDQLHPDIEYVNLTVGMRGSYVRDMATEEPPLLDPLPRLRTLTDRPLLISQGFRDQSAMERALRDGADLVGMARPLIADPDLPNKILQGSPEAVRPCVSCNEDCRAFDPVLLCSVNPELAPPGERWRPATPLVLGSGLNGRSNRVAIVGAGPAGLECALSLGGGSGREVVVWERGEAVGGGLALAGAAPHRHGWLRMVDYYRAGLADGNVEIRLGQQPAASELEEFDAIVVACGAEEVITVPDEHGLAVTASAAISAGPGPLEGLARLVVFDDGFGWWQSVAAVELAIAAGVGEVTVVTPGTGFASAITGENRTQLMPRLRGIRLSIRALSTVTGVDRGGVRVRHAATGEIEQLDAEAVIVVGERRPRDWAALLPDGANAFVVGDAIVPRQFAHAISEGRAAARAIARTQADDRVAWSR